MDQGIEGGEGCVKRAMAERFGHGRFGQDVLARTIWPRTFWPDKGKSFESTRNIINNRILK